VEVVGGRSFREGPTQKRIVAMKKQAKAAHSKPKAYCPILES
jgi:hypothetical protein